VLWGHLLKPEATPAVSQSGKQGILNLKHDGTAESYVEEF